MADAVHARAGSEQTAGPTPAPRRRRPVLPVLAIVGAFLAAVGGVVGFVVYDRATAIDRSTPAISARQFMHAAVDDVDPASLVHFVCRGWSAQDVLDQLASYRGPTANVTWSVQRAESAGPDRADVAVLVEMSAGTGSRVVEGRETWVLEAANEDGWRICSIRREDSLEP